MEISTESDYEILFGGFDKDMNPIEAESKIEDVNEVIKSKERITPHDLSNIWKSMTEKIHVIGFYQQKNYETGCFSNFYKLNYHFDLPYIMLGISEQDKKFFPSPVKCTTSEKTIMLCKAALMKDRNIYNKIMKLENPKEIKHLGQQVKPFNDEKWNEHICQIAVECVYQKFSKGSEKIKQCLKNTNSAIIAEAAYNDKNWGIGMGVYDNISIPANWRGTNILGWALMETRTQLFL